MVKENNKISRVLVVKFRYHGDMILTTPLISSLKKSYPASKIDILLYEDTAPVLSYNEDINKLYTLSRKKDSLIEKIKESFLVFKTLRKNNYDLVINLADQWPIALMTSFLPSKRIGVYKGDKIKGKIWSRFFDKTVRVNAEEHIVLQNLSFLENECIRTTKLSMHYSKDDTKILSKIPPESIGNYILIQPTTRQYYKYWDNDKFSIVINHFKESGFEVILTSGPSQHEKDIVYDIFKQCKAKPFISLAGETSFPELAVLIDNAKLFIGLDSAPMHMAAALETPVVALFGPTDHKVWRPWTENYRQLWAGDYEKMPDNADYNKSIKYLSCIPAQDVICAAEELIKKVYR
ncbi:putative lipopolysaccharide heptosyltransferase III [Tatumella sp. UBA2305]|uniref:putative lipopolysaccharide heptosyltransferase III n=1 Tax=Tatumella sp. UBA2305 TaxID=1947647 RepID=UPI0025E716AB|nr:putative lipopolysaccharide heptosyltransferase III [Tatumella sp. UBA2305]